MTATAATASILVVVTRRIGDVLLATPLIRALRLALPQSSIDALVFAGTGVALAGNPDVRSVLEIGQRPTFAEHLAFVRRIARRYDLALSLVASDRPTLYAWIAGRQRHGILLDAQGQHWKRRLLHTWVPLDDSNTHTVLMHLALADRLGIPRSYEVVVGWRAQEEAQVDALLGPEGVPLAVLHAYPRYRYKMWRREHWVALGERLARRGLRIALSGGADPEEIRYVDSIATELPRPTLMLAGKLSLPATACLIARASVYVGPDTATTHVAAAVGAPTVALFGPSDPVKWGPWPKGHAAAENPWQRVGSQTCRNVTLLQGTEPCVPCRLEGCERHVNSISRCLLDLPVDRVAGAADQALARARAA